MPTGSLSEIGKPVSTISTGKAKLSQITPPTPVPIKTGKASLANIAPPKIEMPNLNRSIKSGLDSAYNAASSAGEWATTSLMPDAEEGVGELAGKIPLIGDYAKPVAKFIVGGVTSPLGLATMGVGTMLHKSYKAAKLAKLIPEGPLTAEQALVAEIQGARPIRHMTDKLRSAELGKRSAKLDTAFNTLKGEGGANIAMGELKGALPKIDFESVAPKFTQDNIDTFYDKITKSKLLTPLDKASAKEGLDKIFGSAGGQVPQTSEINLLTREFGPEFAKALESKMGLQHKVLDTLGVPRTLMASGDVSFPFRQNISNVSRPLFWKNLPTMFKVAPEAGQKAMMSAIKGDKHYELATRMGVDIGDYIHEENFATRAARFLPWVKPSENAFNISKKVRMDLFSQMVDKLQDGKGLFWNAKVDPYTNHRVARELAKFVNTSSGRGTLKVGAGAFTADLERGAKFMNSMFFSPRLASSRIQMFSKIFDPKVPQQIRREYIRNALGYMAFQGATLTAAYLGGAEVVSKLTSSDFGKVKIGNTRLDFSGGVTGYVRLLAQIAYGEKTSSITGKTTEFGKGYRAPTANDAVGSFVTQKAAPIPATALDIGRGWKDAVGQPVTVSSEALKLVTPIILSDINDIMKDDPNNLPYIIPAMFGVGIQTYGAKDIAKEPKNPLKVSIPSTKLKVKLN